MNSSELLWNIAVPVKVGEFVALSSDYQAYNVQTDLASIKPFSIPKNEPSVLYCDIQINCDVNFPRRLGSGRSGFYQDKYLKGIGRTQLASNWCSPNDIYHGTGHLAASGAAREYLVSKWIERVGLAGSIVPCESILIKEIDPLLLGYMNTICPSVRGQVKPISDNFLQAISVKPGGFARLSNVNWLLNVWHAIPDQSSISYFFEILATFIDPLSIGINFDSESLSKGLSEALIRGYENYKKFIKAGIYWGSFHNNSTLDGRFLDLELPLIFAGPCFGITQTMKPGKSSDNVVEFVIGTEIFKFITQARFFVNIFISRLKELLVLRGLSQIEKSFLADFVESFQKNILSTAICSDEVLIEDMRKFYISTFSTSSTAEKWYSDLAKAAFDFHIYGKYTRIKPVQLARYPIDEAVVEINSPQIIWVPEFNEMPSEDLLIDVKEWYERIARADDCSDVDSFLRAVG